MNIGKFTRLNKRRPSYTLLDEYGYIEYHNLSLFTYDKTSNELELTLEIKSCKPDINRERIIIDKIDIFIFIGRLINNIYPNSLINKKDRSSSTLFRPYKVYKSFIIR